MKGRILEIVRLAVSELNEELGYEELENLTEGSVLFGGDSPLDSLSLVTLVVELEARIADAFGQAVVLADEKAMSERNSPYRTVGALSGFIEERLSSVA